MIRPSKNTAAALFSWAAISTLLATHAVQGQEIQIDPPLKAERVTAERGQTHMITCLFAGGDYRAETIGWFKAGTEISGEHKQSVYTLEMSGKKFLIFKQLNERDTGTYTCRVTYTGDAGTPEQIEHNVPLVVVVPATWKDPAVEVGRMEGQVLTIDCNADGEPKPQISISGVAGKSLPGEYVVANDNRLTIDGVSAARDQGAKVLCIATQFFSDLGHTTIQTRAVTVDVYTKPEFDDAESRAYGVAGQPTELVCRVTSSNPPVYAFSFYHDQKKITDNAEMKIEVDDGKQTATLKIAKFDESQVGQYRCDASNGKEGGEFSIVLSAAAPPGAVKIALEKALSNGFQWSLTVPPVETADEGADVLPVLRYRLQYLRTKELDDIKATTAKSELANELKRIWATAKKEYFTNSADPDSMYTVKGLRTETPYTFRVQAINAAGRGDFQEIQAVTISKAEELKQQKQIGASGADKTSPLTSSLLCLLGVVVSLRLLL